MYRLKPGIKQDPQRRWLLPDRIFFGHGACHILAGVYLRNAPLPGFWAERIIPADGKPGNHVYVTDGTIAFDFHGYSDREALLRHHVRGWRRASGPEWRCTVESVRFDLLDTPALNARKMRGPDQYFDDPCRRAQVFLARFDHAACAERARQRRGTARG